MKEVAKVVTLIGASSGYNDKLALLKKYANTPGLKETLRFIYNPYCKTGISDAKLSKGLDSASPSEISDRVSWQDAIKYFGTHQTGSDADLYFARTFVWSTLNEHGVEAMRLACALVTQNLKIGITATSLNKVYGSDFIPKTGCMLGTVFDDVPAHKISWPCIVTEKLDGIRRILVKENGVCRFYSRSGHEDTGLVEIMEEAKYLPDNKVYDGELLAAGEFKDCIAQRQATNSIANSKGMKTGLTFNVFDMVDIYDFYKGKSTDSALARKKLLGATLMDESIQLLDDANWAMQIAAFGVHRDLKFIKPVPILGIVECLDEAEPIVEKIWARGGKGIMAMLELHACIIADKRLLKNGASRLYSLVIYRQADESYVRHHMVGTDLIWIECIESVGRSHVDASVRSLEKGIRDGMAASESVTGREHLYIVS